MIRSATVTKSGQVDVGYNHLLSHLAQLQHHPPNREAGADEEDDADDSSDDMTATSENSLPGFLKANTAAFLSEDLKLAEPSLSIDDWIAREDAKIVNAVVSEPQVVPGNANRRKSSTSLQSMFVKNKVLYCVVVEGLEITKTNNVRFVERIFDDFAVLREVLVRRFPGSCPPALPPTAKLGANREQIARKRSRLLTLFLQAVADHPFYRNDQVFQIFIASPMIFKEALDKFTGAKSEGTERWRQAMRTASVSLDPLTLIDTLKMELREVEQRLESLKEAAKHEVEKAILRVNSSREMVTAFNSWLAVEGQMSSPLAGSASVDVRERDLRLTLEVSLPDALHPLAIKYGNHTNVLEHEYGESQMDTSVTDLTRFELGNIAVWQAALDEAYKAERLAAKYADIVKAMPESKTKTGENSKKDLQLARAEQAKYLRGLLGVELVRFKISRVTRAVRLKLCITRMHVEGAEAILSVWRTETSKDRTHVDVSQYQNGDALGHDENDRQNHPSSLQMPASKPILIEAQPQVIVKEVLSDDKIHALAMSVASKAVEESRAQSAAQDAARLKRQDEEAAKLRSADAHKDCRTQGEVADMFWNLVYCLIALHLFFITVFVLRGYVRESFPMVVLAGLTFISGFLVEIVYK